MNKITKLEEFAIYIPELKKLYRKLDGKLESELSADQFTDKLLQMFSPKNDFYGNIADGEIEYFLVVLNGGFPRMFFWLFYINVKSRDKSRYYIKQVLDAAKLEGFTEVTFGSVNISSSYRRWVSKFGAKPHSINYKIIL